MEQIESLLGWRVAVAALAVAFTPKLVRYFKVSELPPGPRKLPIVGNALNFPSQYEWLTFVEWSKQYGEYHNCLCSDVLYAKLFGQDIVILNSFSAAEELLVKKSVATSNRPTYTMMNELSGASYMFAFMKYGDEWKQKRTLFHQTFRHGSSYQPDALAVIRKFLPQFLHDPRNFEHHTFRMTAALAMLVGYGLDLPFTEDEYTARIERGQQCIRSASLPGAYFVDYLPILRYLPGWLPGCGFKNQAEIWRKHVTDMRDAPFEVAKEAIVKGEANASFVGRCLEKTLDDEATDEIAQEQMISDVAGNLYTAATDTTAATLSIFTLLMTCHPEVQEKAYKELKGVLDTRLPTFEDKVNLPYITAIMKEVLRYHPTAPMGVAHVADADTFVQGYRVPSQSIIIPNAWAMLRDESIFGPNTSEFLPERFLQADGKLNGDLPHPDFGFGFGRRMCVGQEIAESFLWISMASLLTCFKFSKPRDAKGNEQTPKIGFTSGLVTRPLQFDCLVEARRECVTLLSSEDRL